MEIAHLIELRQSVRAFKDQKIDSESIRKILEAARLAPSAVNFQPWRFIVVDDDHLLENLWLSYPRQWLKSAPQAILVCGNHTESWKRAADNKDHCDIDAAIAIDHITLMATSLGIGTCWVCNFNPQIIRESFHLPDNIEPIAIIPLGYPLEPLLPVDKNRKPLNEIAFHNGLVIPFE
jgi:nitroreductase